MGLTMYFFRRISTFTEVIESKLRQNLIGEYDIDQVLNYLRSNLTTDSFAVAYPSIGVRHGFASDGKSM